MPKYTEGTLSPSGKYIVQNGAWVKVEDARAGQSAAHRLGGLGRGTQPMLGSSAAPSAAGEDRAVADQRPRGREFTEEEIKAGEGTKRPEDRPGLLSRMGTEASRWWENAVENTKRDKPEGFDYAGAFSRISGKEEAKPVTPEGEKKEDKDKGPTEDAVTSALKDASQEAFPGEFNTGPQRPTPPLTTPEGKPDVNALIETSGRAEDGDEDAKKALTDLGKFTDIEQRQDDQARENETGVGPFADHSTRTAEAPAEEKPPVTGGGALDLSSVDGESKGLTSLQGQAIGTAAGGLIGSGIAALFGGGDAAGKFMEGYTPEGLAQFKRSQEIDLKRRQAMFEQVAASVANFPPELFEDETFGEFSALAQKVQKDLADGVVDDEATASKWIAAQAKFAPEIAAGKKVVAYENKLREMNEQAQINAEVARQQRTRLHELVMAGGPDAQWAQGELRRLDMDLEKFEMEKKALEERTTYMKEQIRQGNAAHALRERSVAAQERVADARVSAMGRADQGKATQAQATALLDEINKRGRSASAQAGLDEFNRPNLDPYAGMANTLKEDPQLAMRVAQALGIQPEIQGGVRGFIIDGSFVPQDQAAFTLIGKLAAQGRFGQDAMGGGMTSMGEPDDF